MSVEEWQGANWGHKKLIHLSNWCANIILAHSVPRFLVICNEKITLFFARIIHQLQVGEVVKFQML